MAQESIRRGRREHRTWLAMLTVIAFIVVALKSGV